MTQEELMKELEERQLSDIIELIEDADRGKLEVLELAPSLGLLRDEKLNEEVLSLLKEKGVEIEYVSEEEEE
ncbi:hypothetical protein FLK61_31000 [Paenalkalicoccus suaedae]|uniref:RNA polymerase sigma factor 70 region 1.1 domain-containing protein n=1 Tax=Paenalkalicoccus suaedae TaxID=2592382 RepID=A0A859FG11_9BACI|nr:hypothetical protein [Paenalkalicoccus suaedae]QKS71145.1 hypothetical protein FLK61_31000 [Paenalkalicoccus suaedae]